MLTHPSQLTDTEFPGSVGRVIGRFFFGAAAGATLVSATLLLLLPGLPIGQRLAVVSSLIVMAAAAGLATQLSQRARFPMNAALVGVALAELLLTGLVAFMLGEGVRSPILGFLGLLVCVVAAITGVRHGLVLSAVACAELAALAWAESAGMFPGVIAPTTLVMALMYQWLVVVCALIGGVLISRTIDHFVQAATGREERFRGLLHIAADWYWEQDQHFRFTYMSEATAEVSGIAWAERMQRRPWEVTNIGLTEDQLDAHRADLEAHRSFRGLVVRRPDPDGEPRAFSISGEPKFDARGVFIGYWGVARDVTEEARAQQAVVASEARYRELFERSASPLFLHRRGIVIDANAAAARLFGFADAEAMQGFNIVELFPAGEERDKVIERMAWLEGRPVGEGLPVADQRLRSIDGRAAAGRQALHFLERDLLVRRGLAELDAETLFQVFYDRIRPTQHARDVGADADLVLADRLEVVHRIKGGNLVHLNGTHPKQFGHIVHERHRQPAVFFLAYAQCRHHGRRLAFGWIFRDFTLDLVERFFGKHNDYRSISPNTMSWVPMIATTSASMWPRDISPSAARCA